MISVIWKLSPGDNPKWFQESLDHARKQPGKIETVAVVDSSLPEVQTVDTEIQIDSNSLTMARNQGARAASGDVVAFMDADAYPKPQWSTYVRDALGNYDFAGGPLVPELIDRNSLWLPDEWHWLIGCGPYYDEPQLVPNTYGSNIAVDREAFLDVNGFDESIGIGSDSVQQGGETKLAQDLRQQGYNGLYYHPEMKVAHKIPSSRLEIEYLLKRAWNQGKAKAHVGFEEREQKFITDELLPAMKRGPVSGLVSLAFTGVVGAGYIRGKL